MYRLIESIRLLDGQFHHLPYHQRRLANSMKVLLGTNSPWLLEPFLKEQEYPQKGLHKCRVVYDQQNISAVFESYTIRPVATLKLVEDNAIEYSHKMEDRSELNGLWNERGSCDDVLIIKNGEITDSTYANIVFRKKEEWFTPRSFLLNGIMRQHLLEAGLIKETEIQSSDISSYESFKLINALVAFDFPETEVSNIL